MKIFTRKEEVVTTPFVKIKPIWQYLAVFVSFIFTNLYVLRGQFAATIEIYASSFPSLDIQITMTSFIIFVVLNALVSTVLLEFFMTIYYFFGFQGMRGLMPLSNNEFKANLRPFMVIRNVIWALLSLTMFIEGGVTVGLGYVLFENLSTMIVILPAFFFIKKYYFKDGYAGRALSSIILPYLIITTMTQVGLFI